MKRNGVAVVVVPTTATFSGNGGSLHIFNRAEYAKFYGSNLHTTLIAKCQARKLNIIFKVFGMTRPDSYIRPSNSEAYTVATTQQRRHEEKCTPF